MPCPFLNDPTHWRARAAEMRALADETNDIEASRLILKLAEDYERLAQRAEIRSDGRIPTST
jgi:hypothetical protein